VNIWSWILPTLTLVKIPAKKNQDIFLFLILISVNKLLKYIFSKTCKISISTLSIFFNFLFFGGWAGLSQPDPVTGPSQWPGWAEQHAWRTRVATMCKWIKIHLHRVNGKVLGSVVAVAFQITFCAEMHANDVFYFLKIIFNTSTSKQSKTYKLY